MTPSYLRGAQNIVRTSFAFAGLTAAAVLFTGCGNQQDDQYTQTTTTPAPTDTTSTAATATAGTTGTMTASTTPAQQGELEQRIRQDLRNADTITLDDQQIERLTIRVQGSMVTLSGNVPSQEASRQIEQRVRQVSGVQTVQNQLQAERTAE